MESKRTRNNRLPKGGIVSAVVPRSLAAVAGLAVGDRVEAVNGFVLQDLIDYRYQSCDPKVIMRYWREGESREVTIIKEPDQDLGLHFDEAVFDRVRQCANKCEFCFIHQMPAGMRETLYIEDDDYRLSFLQGNFITLTNLADRDWNRIYELRLSPLYVSIHATNPQLRRSMLRQPLAERLHAQLDRLAAMGIDFHAQIVLVPGRNDGQELDRTLSELVGRWWPHLLTICIVPYGATRFREELRLPDLQLPSKTWSRAIIRQVNRHQQNFKQVHGDLIVRLADEFYILAEKAFPGVRHYGQFQNLGDGIGGARLLLSEWQREERKLPRELPRPTESTIITGEAAATLLKPIVEGLCAVRNLDARLLPLKSAFWGERITVTGLLTGADILVGLRQNAISGVVWLPSITLRPGSSSFLDGMTVDQVSRASGTEILVLPTEAHGFVLAATAPDRLKDQIENRWFGSYYR